jgi:hypothetical protein
MDSEKEKEQEKEEKSVEEAAPTTEKAPEEEEKKGSEEPSEAAGPILTLTIKLANKTFSLECGELKTIEDLKNICQKDCGADHTQQRLIYKGT